MMFVATAWVVRPLVGRARDPLGKKRQPNLKSRRTTLNALDELLASGTITEAEYTQKRQQVGNDLLNEIAGDEHPSVDPTPAAGQRSLVAFILFTLPAASIALYGWLGTSEALEEHPAVSVSNDIEHADAGSISEMVEALAARLNENPDDAEGWLMLARSYMAMERYGEAAHAYSEARTLVGDEPVLLVDFAEAVTLANNNQMEGLPTQLIERALAVEPTHQKGIWLAGFAAMQRNESDRAVEIWNQLLEQLAPDSREAEAVTNMIAQVGGETSAPAPSTASTASSGVASLAVTIVLDPALAGKVTGHETLFIFARAVNGPPMPLAIQRRSASELPLTITLDDSMSMLPAMKLSGFPVVTVGARISKSGDAIGQSGDLQGMITPIDVAGTAAVEVTISEVLP